MSKRGKSKENYGSDADEQPARKKPSASTTDNDSDNVVVCEIGKNKRVSVMNFHGKTMVDIREFYEKDGKQLPGKKGISLNMDQWKILRDNLEKIDTLVTGSN